MKVLLFNIEAVDPDKERLEKINQSLEGLNVERTWMEVVESENGPMWSILVIVDEEHHHKKPEPLPPLGVQDKEIYEALLDWRRHTARKENLPEFFIMHNRTLQQLALEKPQTIDDLTEISGIGEWKAETYGQALINIIKAISQTQE